MYRYPEGSLAGLNAYEAALDNAGHLDSEAFAIEQAYRKAKPALTAWVLSEAEEGDDIEAACRLQFHEEMRLGRFFQRQALDLWLAV